MNFADFSKLYSVSKTLRFEAKPIGATLEHLTNSSFLEKDKHRAESYIKVTNLIDEYHKAYIDEILSSFTFSRDELTEYKNLYAQKSYEKSNPNSFIDLQHKMRKEISDALQRTDKYERISKKELIREDMFSFIEGAKIEQLCGLSKEEANALLMEFREFTTYFVGFHQNRKNMYSSKEQSTAISYRIINENFPRYIDNIEIFNQIKNIPELTENIKRLNDNCKKHLGISSLDEVFELWNINNILTQNKIDQYNGIIGGWKENNSSAKIQGLNEYINLYNQSHKSSKLPKFKTIYKQILSERKTISWIPKEFSNDNEVLCAIKEYYNKLQDHVLGEKDLKSLLESIESYSQEGIFINNDIHLSNISQRLFGNWNVIENSVKADIKHNYKKRRKESEDDYEKRISDVYKKKKYFSFTYIDNCIKTYYNNASEKISKYFSELYAVNNGVEERENIFLRITKAYAEVSDLLNKDYPFEKKLCQDSTSIAHIKGLLDALKSLQLFIKPLVVMTESGKDERFYGDLAPLWAELDTISLLYDNVRNYVVKKPYSQNKIKLNFDNASLFSGWEENKLTDYGCILLRKDDLYYIGIMAKPYRNILADDMPTTGDCYDRMVYKSFKNIISNIPKCTTQLNRVKEHFKHSNDDIILSEDTFDSPITITREIFDLNNVTYSDKKRFQADYLKITGDHLGYTNAVKKWISFCIQFLKNYKSTKVFDLSSIENKNYDSVDAFYKDVNCLIYKIHFTPVSVEYINDLVKNGKMYLFQLYNKDFSKYSKGTPNMHTLYWKALFDTKNINDTIYKLNGNAELFFRESSIDIINPTHVANKSINNKNKLNPKKESIFAYDLIKDKRYTADKFMFHVPITMNFKCSNSHNDINYLAREYLRTHNDIHVIGIDRGERNLLYIVVIDNKGRIVEQVSLNEIINKFKGVEYRTDYHDLLDSREKERQNARQSWQTIEGIKTLKEGYLSSVVHQICKLIVKYNAIVILEDLNIRFMRGRQKVEKQVYQKFEKMLIDKLNYLVDKRVNPDQPGGLRCAYQLTEHFESFSKLGKQSGFLFYVPAWNTSKIDPTTGFVNLFDTRYETIEKSKLFFSKFSNIRYNKQSDRFELSFDYNNFSTRASGTKTDWTITTHGDRIITFRNSEKNNQWDNKMVNLTKEYKDLFQTYGIDYSDDIKEQIVKQSSKDFFEKLLYCLKLTLQMRNSVVGTDIDYLISPVINKNGCHYDSRHCSESLPQNADANGAFNIARKGLMIIEQISTSSNIKDLKFDISNKSWLDYAQKHAMFDE